MTQAIKESTCSKKLGSGNNGAVYKVCANSECKACVAVKFGAHVHDYEGTFTRIISNATQGTPFEPHVQRFVSMLDINTAKSGPQPLIFTRLEANSGDMYGAKSIPHDVFLGLMVQIFATLNYLHVKTGFLHMDMKTDQILLANGSKEEVLPNVGAGGSGPRGSQTGAAGGSGSAGGRPRAFRVPMMPLRAVLLDYGNGHDGKTEDSKIYDVQSDYRGRCYIPSFDIIRLFDDLDGVRVGPQTKHFIREWRNFVFGGWFAKLTSSKYMDSYHTSTAPACDLMAKLAQDGTIKTKTFTQVLEFPGFRPFWVR